MLAGNVKKKYLVSAKYFSQIAKTVTGSLCESIFQKAKCRSSRKVACFGRFLSFPRGSIYLSERKEQEYIDHSRGRKERIREWLGLVLQRLRLELQARSY